MQRRTRFESKGLKWPVTFYTPDQIASRSQIKTSVWSAVVNGNTNLLTTTSSVLPENWTNGQYKIRTCNILLVRQALYR